jgi:hypothetical protein
MYGARSEGSDHNDEALGRLLRARYGIRSDTNTGKPRGRK